MPRCLISFGGNLGDRGKTLSDAAAAIVAIDGVNDFQASRIYATPAIGGPTDQPPFLNAVATVEVGMSAAQLLEHLQQIELSCGRVRTTRWSARKVDLDLILYGDLIGQRQQLAVPHPRYPARRFVIEPACEVAGDMVDPRFGWTIKQIADHLRNGIPSAILVGGSAEVRGELMRRLQVRGEVQTVTPESIDQWDHARPWIGDFAGGWNQDLESTLGQPRIWMRLLKHPGQIREDWFAQSASLTQWPSPQQLWRGGQEFMQYDLEVSDLQWSAGEIVSAIESMQCDCRPVEGVELWPNG